MKHGEKLLFEMPEILFRGFLKYLGITGIKKFLFKYNNGVLEYAPCLYVPLRRESEYEKPTLVLMDLRPFGINKVRLILLSEMPRIIDGIVENMREYGSITVSEINGTLSVDANTSYLGSINIGNPFSRFTYLYMMDLVKRCDDLYFSKDYKWITKL